jgi:hypothetical protein
MPNGEPTKDGTMLEQSVNLLMVDVNQQAALISVRGRFDIHPTQVALPFALLDVIEWQRLSAKLQQTPGVGVAADNQPGVKTS